MNNYKNFLLSCALLLFFTKIKTGDEPNKIILSQTNTIILHENRIRDLEDKLFKLEKMNERLLIIITQQQKDIRGLANASIIFYEEFEKISPALNTCFK